MNEAKNMRAWQPHATGFWGSSVSLVENTTTWGMGGDVPRDCIDKQNSLFDCTAIKPDNGDYGIYTTAWRDECL